MKQLIVPCKEDTTKFKTTMHDTVEWFDKINHSIFQQQLTPFSKITIKRMGDWWACVRYYPEEKTSDIDLELHKKFSNKWHFINILAHEMVHKWQLEINHDTAAHNKYFYSWRPTFTKHGLDLNRKG